MKTKIPAEWMGLELQHKHGGDGWGIVEILEDDYCRLSWPRAAHHNSNRAFLAWAKLLTPMLRGGVEQPFNADDMAHLEAVRKELASGKKKVVGTYIVKS